MKQALNAFTEISYETRKGLVFEKFGQGFARDAKIARSLQLTTFLNLPRIKRQPSESSKGS